VTLPGPRADGWRPPEGFEPLASTSTRHGRIDLYVDAGPRRVLAHPSGSIGPELLRREIAYLRAFASGRRAVWRYVVDVADVTVVNPLNVLWLRQVKQLPGLDRYDVASPSPVARQVQRALSPVVGAVVHRTLEAALEPT